MLSVTEELYGERTALRQARLNVYNEVLAQLKSDTADAPKLESVLRSGWFVIDERIPIVVQAFAEAHAVLIPEQRAEFVEKIERRQEHRKTAVNTAGIIGIKLTHITGDGHSGSCVGL